MSYSHKTYTGTTITTYNIFENVMEAVAFALLVGTGIFILSISDAIDAVLSGSV